MFEVIKEEFAFPACADDLLLDLCLHFYSEDLIEDERVPAITESKPLLCELPELHVSPEVMVRVVDVREVSQRVSEVRLLAVQLLRTCQEALLNRQ